MPIVCSYCDGRLPSDDELDDMDDMDDVGAVPLMMFQSDGSAAVFCEDCMREWWGFERRGSHEKQS